jgi:hypothetical protein
MSTMTPPTAPPTVPPQPGTSQLTQNEVTFLEIADRALHDAEKAVVAVGIAKTQADALKDAALSAAITENVATAIEAARTTKVERDAAHDAAEGRDPARVRQHAELARAAADRAVAAQDAAVIRVEMESLAIASLERDFTRVTGLTLGDPRPIRDRSHPYSNIGRE